MSNHPIIVQKYGGVCLETPARIRAVASSLADLHNGGHRVVAIVSAISRWLLLPERADSMSEKLAGSVST